MLNTGGEISANGTRKFNFQKSRNDEGKNAGGSEFARNLY